VICDNTVGSDIWVMSAIDGSGKTNLIDDNMTNDLRPTFSPNGNQIDFESNRYGVGSRQNSTRCPPPPAPR
jgi:Tol biopolymer transport system component